jgi:hypothetical protein
MTAPTDQFIDTTKRSQDAFTAVAQTWADFMQSMAGSVPGLSVPGLSVPGFNVPENDAPTSAVTAVTQVHPYVDSYFDLADKLLANQRAIFHYWLEAAAKANEAVTEQAVRATKSVSAHAANGAEAVVDNGAEAVGRTGERAASSARAARQLGQG